MAAVLRLSAATVQLYAREGRIPFDTTPGGHRRYDVAEVQAALIGGVGDVESELGRRRLPGLGQGVEASSSANATLLRGLRSARPEPRLGGVEPATEAESALGQLVAHARHVTLATVPA